MNQRGAKMGWLAYVIAGLVLTAVGTLLIVIGGSKRGAIDSATANARVEDVLVRLEKAQTEQPAGSPSASKIEGIETEFRDWAGHFLKSRDAREVEGAREVLARREKELKFSEQARPIFVSFIDSIRRSVDAYNLEAKTDFSYQFNELPTNFFAAARGLSDIGAVTFHDGVVWRAQVQFDLPVSEMPSLWLRVDERADGGGDPPRLRIGPSVEAPDSQIRVAMFGNTLPTSESVRGSYPLADVHGWMPKLVRTLFEAQILALPTTATTRSRQGEK
jgi:hypothetical protein